MAPRQQRDILWRVILGTAITLEIAGIAVTYAKSERGLDHGALFQEGDRQAVKSDQIDYNYYELENADPTAAEMAFRRPLKEVVPRLELLGFGLHRVRREYGAIAESWQGERQLFLDEGSRPLPEPMDFPEFLRFATEHPLASLDDSFVAGIDVESDRTIRGRFTDQAMLSRIPNYMPHSVEAYSERSYFGELVNFLHPYSVMRLLAEGNSSGNASVVWQYGPLVSAGWATEAEFAPGARRAEKFLVATEGSSDVHILKHALALLKPGVADFFRFIDVSKSHPFPGTGNLVKFAEGLVKIDVQNQVVFLLDNDAEGLAAHKRLSGLTLPPNMRSVMLPALEAFRAFPAQGPDGASESDINRRAAALECYLDLDVRGYPKPKVLWTNYKSDLDIYHGRLEHKEMYAKEFLKQTIETIGDGSYFTGKIEAALDSLISECKGIVQEQWE